MTAAVLVGLLTAAGIYLTLQRGLIRVSLGFVLLGHAVNVLLVAAGGLAYRREPLIGQAPPARMADPLPQAFVLTAIVITFGVTVYLLALARAGGEDDPHADTAEPEVEPPVPNEDDADPDARTGGAGPPAPRRRRW